MTTNAQTSESDPVRSGPLFDELAQFVHVWQRTAVGWKLARVLSFDHQIELVEPTNTDGE